MRVLVGCKRGNIAERNKHGHCMCIDCVSFRNKRSNETKNPEVRAVWLAANKEKSAAYQKKWIAANKEQRRDIEKAWREKNPSKVAAMSAKAGKKWSGNNRAKRLASVRNRQLAKRYRTLGWASRDEIAKIYIQAATLTANTGIRHEVDHIIPQGKTVSGLHVEHNLQILTMAENHSKGVRLCVS